MYTVISENKLALFSEAEISIVTDHSISSEIIRYPRKTPTYIQ